MGNQISKQIYNHQFTGNVPNPSSLSLANDGPPWRQFAPKLIPSTTNGTTPRPMDEDQAARGRKYLADETEARLVNAALVLRRPLLITGQAGVGKTSLAYSVAQQLGLGNVLRWNVTSRSTLKDALYHYDALARLHNASLRASLREKGLAEPSLDFGDYITLGPLGTALLPTNAAGYFPRVLLIDEIDKSDADLPSDLLHVLEEGSFTIPEVDRLPQAHKGKTIQVNTCESSIGRVSIPSDGRIRCDDFPLIIMTSNGDRDFPPAFLRRCLQLAIPRPSLKKLETIINAHLGVDTMQDPDVGKLLNIFDSQRSEKESLLAIDQLLNAIYLASSAANVSPLEHTAIKEAVFRSLSESPQVGTI